MIFDITHLSATVTRGPHLGLTRSRDFDSGQRAGMVVDGGERENTPEVLSHSFQHAWTL